MWQTSARFAFHYETQQLNREIGRFRPDDEVSISVKLHGTSLVIGNVLTLKPRWGGLYARFFNYLPSFLQLTRPGYDVVYSSRTVIKNNYFIVGGSDILATLKADLLTNDLIPMLNEFYSEYGDKKYSQQYDAVLQELNQLDTISFEICEGLGYKHEDAFYPAQR